MLRTNSIMGMMKRNHISHCRRSTKETTPEDQLIKLGVGLSHALHAAGQPAHALEDAMNRVWSALGVQAAVFAEPTLITLAFGDADDQRVVLDRVAPGGFDLGRMAELDRLVDRLASGELSIAEGLAEVSRIEAGPALWGPLSTVVAHAAVAGTVGLLLGGGPPEALTAAVIGTIIGLLQHLADRHAAVARVFELASAFVAGFAATWLLPLIGPGSPLVAMAAGLIVLVPGYTLTTALTEIACQHLSAGAARLSAAAGTFLLLAIGVTGGRALALATGALAAEGGVAPLPWWVEWSALVVSSLAFAVLFRTRVRDAGWIVAAGLLAHVATLTGSELMGPQLAGFAGALAVSTGANLFAHLARRPAALIMVPGIMMLVPGSMGFRGVALMLQDGVVSGLDTAFAAVIVAGSLVAGVLVGSLLVPSPSACRVFRAQRPSIVADCAAL